MAHDTQYAILTYNFGMTYSVGRQTRTGRINALKQATGTKRTRVHARLANIPHGCALDHVPHREALDRLVFADAPRAVGAAHKHNVSTPLLVAAAVSSFLGLSSVRERVGVCPDGRCRVGTSMLPSPHPSRPSVVFLVLDASPARKRSRNVMSENRLTMLQSPGVSRMSVVTNPSPHATSAFGIHRVCSHAPAQLRPALSNNR